MEDAPGKGHPSVGWHGPCALPRQAMWDVSGSLLSVDVAGVRCALIATPSVILF